MKNISQPKSHCFCNISASLARPADKNFHFSCTNSKLIAVLTTSSTAIPGGAAAWNVELTGVAISRVRVERFVSEPCRSL